MQINRIAQNSYQNYQVDRNEQVKPVQSQAIGMPISQTPISSPKEQMNILKKILGEKELYKMGIIKCSACESRRYQDGSNDPGVSFKAPGKISPEASAAIVKSHEMEHVFNEKAKAEQEDREVISQSVQLFTSVCPECGRAYVAGGKTTTTTADKPKSRIGEDMLKGVYLDERT